MAKKEMYNSAHKMQSLNVQHSNSVLCTVHVNNFWLCELCHKCVSPSKGLT